MAISQFKAQALQLIEEVAKSKQSILILKRGQAVAEVIPFRKKEKPQLGKLSDTVLYEGDIISPLTEDWEVLR